MNASWTLATDSIWLHYVLEPAVRALVLGGAAWLLLGAFRVREVSLRLAAWTFILYAALAMPFLSRIVPEVPLPLLSAQPAERIAGNLAAAKGTAESVVAHFAVFHPGKAQAGRNQESAKTDLAAISGTRGAPTDIPWKAVAITVYLFVAMIFLGRLILGLVSGGRLRRSAVPIFDGRLRDQLARESRKAGLKRIPLLAESAALSVPATLGLLRPAILLPMEWKRWTESEAGAVLAHELSHVARHDGVTQAVSRLYRALFWFSPLSWWLDHALVELAEQVSDDAALRAGADRIRYAEVLLHFLRVLRAASGRVRWEGVSMAQGKRSERRLERILYNSSLSRGLGVAAVVAVALAAVPLIGLVAAVQPSRVRPVPMPLASAPPPPPPLTMVPLPSPTPLVPAKSTAVARPVTVEAAADRSGEDQTCQGNQAFAVASGRTVIGECTSAVDLARVWKLHLRMGDSLLWFRRGGRSYIVRNPATVKAALIAFAPLRTIAARQALLDWRESELVRDQMESVARWMTAGFQAPDFTGQLPDLETRILAIEAAPTPRALSRAQAEFVQAEWNAIESSMARTDVLAASNLEAEERQQAALNAQQVALARGQADLERRESELARQAAIRTRMLIERSLRLGLAKPQTTLPAQPVASLPISQGL